METTSGKMTVAQGLKELKIVDDRISKRIETLRKIAAGTTTIVPLYETKEKQTDKVMQLVQSVDDLITRKFDLKKAIERANLETTVAFKGKTYTLKDILLIKEHGKKGRLTGFDLMKNVVESIKMAEANAERQVQDAKKNDSDKKIDVERYFDTDWLEKRNEELFELHQTLDYLIEEANFRTEINMSPMSEE